MTHIQQRRDTFANWTLVNPVLMDGEAGHEKDTGRWKLGDGVTPYIDLPYKSSVDSVAGRTGDVTLAVGDVAGAAPLASPTFTGTPSAPTPNSVEDSTRLATTEWVRDRIAPYAPLDSPALTGSPTAPTPATADNDTSLATTAFVKAQAYAPLDSPALTGNPTAPTPAATDNDNSIATTAFVKSQGIWTPYTPVMGMGWGVGTGSLQGAYTLIGDTVHFRIVAVLGSGHSAPNSGISFSLPFTCETLGPGAPKYQALLSGIFTDAGSNNYVAAMGISGSTVYLYVPGTNGAYSTPSAVHPFTWAVGDFIEASGTYQRDI